jgi:D-tyrosyl-tRNA(Tyr) deacylase
MRAVIQRIKEAHLFVEGRAQAKCQTGILALIALEKEDTEEKGRRLVEKILSLRLFSDERGKMAHSLREEKGDLLLVSNFTLSGELKKGNLPDFSRALPRAEAEPLFHRTLTYARSIYPRVESGVFGAMMEIKIVLDGPVTLILEVR